MTATGPIANDHPLKIAWDKYRETDDAKNTEKWARHFEVKAQPRDGSILISQPHLTGSLWATFMAGYDCRADLCTPTDERVRALEAENAHLRAVVDRAGELAMQRASHAFIIEALSRYEGGLMQDKAMQNRAALRDTGEG